MAARGIILAEHDVAELNRLIQSRAAFYRHDLEHIEALVRELDRADVVTAATLAPDIVTMRSRVRVRDLETGRGGIYTIVPPMDADAAARRVSVLAPMYLQYQNRKAEFFEAVWKVWNWTDAAARFRAVKDMDVKLPGTSRH